MIRPQALKVEVTRYQIMIGINPERHIRYQMLFHIKAMVQTLLQLNLGDSMTKTEHIFSCLHYPST